MLRLNCLRNRSLAKKNLICVYLPLESKLLPSFQNADRKLQLLCRGQTTVVFLSGSRAGTQPPLQKCKRKSYFFRPVHYLPTYSGAPRPGQRSYIAQNSVTKKCIHTLLRCICLNTTYKALKHMLHF